MAPGFTAISIKLNTNMYRCNGKPNFLQNCEKYLKDTVHILNNKNIYFVKFAKPLLINVIYNTKQILQTFLLS